MRYPHSGVARDQFGNTMADATVACYLAGTTTIATIYALPTGASETIATTAIDGSFVFYVDDSDYQLSQRFKTTISKSGYTSQTKDNIIIFVPPVESGEWSPVFTCGTSGTVTLNSSFNKGRYTKIGKLVAINAYLKLSVSSPQGSLKITGLPYNGGNDAKHCSALSVYATGLEATATTALQAVLQVDRIMLTTFAAGVAGDGAASMKTDAYLSISGIYETA
jgi:hypothetical protein